MKKENKKNTSSNNFVKSNINKNFKEVYKDTRKNFGSGKKR